MEQSKPTDSKTFPSEFTLNEYQTLAMRTAKDFGDSRWNLVHGGLGITSDAGEAADVIKAHAIYGKPLDRAHLIEELGDTLWFISQLAKCIDCTLADIARANIEKLRRRYPDGFSDSLAIERLDKKGGI